jgi:hypothetical protein
MDRIFVCYRRNASASHARRIADALSDRYGSESVFFDKHVLRGGDQFRARIERTLSNCRAIVVVIGPRWANLRRGNQRRLDDPEDVVAFEITTALQARLLVIPTLLPGARLPREDELPSQLRALTKHQYIKLSNEHWAEDIQQLFQVLDPEADARLARANSALESDEIYEALEQLRHLPMREWDAGRATEQERLVRKLLQRVSRRPLAVHQLQDPAWSIDVCEGDVCLAIGHRDGSASIRRLRSNQHVDGELLGQDAALRWNPQMLRLDLDASSRKIRDSSSDRPAVVRFLPGGTEIKPFLIEHGVSSRSGWLAVTRVPSAEPNVQEAYAIIDEPGGASIRFTNATGTVVFQTNVERAELWGIRVAEVLHTHQRWVVAATVSGSIAVSPIAERVELSWQELPDLGNLVAIHSFDNEYGNAWVLVVGSSAVFVVELGGSEPWLHILRGRTTAVITDAIRLTPGLAIAIGYSDGVVEVHTQTERHWSSQALRAFDAPVSRLRASKTHYLFVATDGHGRALVWRGNRNLSFFWNDCPILDATFLEESDKLLTVDFRNRLTLWDAVGHGAYERIELEDVFSYLRPCDYRSGFSVTVDSGRLLLHGPDFGMARYWQASAGAKLLRAAGALDVPWEQSENTDRLYYGPKELAWSDVDTFFGVTSETVGDAYHQSLSKVIAHKYAFDANGAALHLTRELPRAAILAISAAPQGQELAVLQQYPDPHSRRYRGMLRRVLFDERELPESLLPSGAWLTDRGRIGYSARGTYIVVSDFDSSSTLRLYQLSSGRWFEAADIVGLEQGEIGGENWMCLETSLYACTFYGEIVQLDLTTEGPKLLRRFAQPPGRYTLEERWRAVQALAVSSDGRWLVAARANDLVIWSASNSVPAQQVPDDGNVHLCLFARASTRFVTFDAAGRCLVRSAETGDTLYELFPADVSYVAFGPDSSELFVRINDKLGNRFLRVPFFADPASFSKYWFRSLRSPLSTDD